MLVELLQVKLLHLRSPRSCKLSVLLVVLPGNNLSPLSGSSTHRVRRTNGYRGLDHSSPAWERSCCIILLYSISIGSLLAIKVSRSARCLSTRCDGLQSLVLDRAFRVVRSSRCCRCLLGVSSCLEGRFRRGLLRLCAESTRYQHHRWRKQI